VPPPPPATPTPLKETINGEFAALLAIDRDALRVPAAEGVNTTCTAHDAPAGVEATPTVAEGNASEPGETDRLDEGGGVTPPATPVPVKEIVSGELAALL
jgi:hypothetical protein